MLLIAVLQKCFCQSVTVSEDLTVAVHINGVCMKSKMYRHLLSQDNKVASVVDVANIAACAKSHLELSFGEPEASKSSTCIRIALFYLESALEDDTQEDKQLSSLLFFV